MFLTKFWTLILLILIALLFSVIYLVPSSIDESRVSNIRALILKDRLQMESILKMEARSRLDTLIVFSVDQTVREQLAEACKRKDSAQVPMETKEKLLSQMRVLNEKLTTFKADILIAVDRDGIVIAQVGENERSSGYSLKGFPLVQAALRGFVRDDSWLFDGKLYRMSARPVIHAGMYVGAIIHGQKMDKNFSDLLARATESQVGIYVEDHTIAVAVPGAAEGAEEAEKGKEAKGKGGKEENGEKGAQKIEYATDAQINTLLMDEVFKDKKYNETGRSDIILSKSKYYVVAVRMVGEARMNNAGFVLIRRVPRIGGISDFLQSINKSELAAVPWWKIGTLAGLLLVLGILIIYLEGDRPKSRFLKEVDKMTAKEGERLNIYIFRGKWRKLADSINRAIDKAVQVLVSKATSDAPSVSKILGTAPKDDRLSKPAFEVPSQIRLDDIPPPPPDPSKAAAGRKGRTPTMPSMTPPVVPPAAAAPGQRPAAAAPQPPPSRPMPPAGPPGQPAPAQHRPAPVAAATPAVPPVPGRKQGLVSPDISGLQTWGSGVDEEETKVYEGERDQILSGIPSVPPDARAQQRPTPSAPVAASQVSGEDAVYKRIFDEFYKTKVACGEPVDTLTFDRFKATLKKQEEAIRERTRCRKVDFKVYVKDGKAALKASPIK
jgi:hypothetical protein